MNNIFFTADHHFGHTNILKYEAAKRVDKNGRTFATVEQMNEHLINEWNAVVSPADLVYYLGDFAFKADITREVLKRLNGEKVLVIGNHDPHFKSVMRGENLQTVDGFSDVYKQFEIMMNGVGAAMMSHFPYAPANQGDLSASETNLTQYCPKRGPERILLHGHVHSRWLIKKEPGTPLMVNIGVDVWGLRPASFDEIVELVSAWEYEDYLRCNDGEAPRSNGMYPLKGTFT